MSNKKPIIIYRDHLLPFSETFIVSQSESLQRYTPFYFGSRRVKGLSLPAERCLVANNGGAIGKLKETIHLSLQFNPYLLKQGQKINPAFIHAHFGIDAVSVLPMAKALSIPLITTFHGVDITTKDNYAKKSFYRHRRFLKYRETLKHEGTAFIAVSKFIEQKLKSAGFPEEKIFQHYIGINVDLFTPDRTINREPIVLFVGRLVEKKGCQYLIQAMAEVQKSRPELELLVIGEGKLKPALEEQAKRSLKHVRFLGVQTPHQVRAWMNKAMLFSVPSIVAESGDSEAFGMVFAEAQSMGLPVVSFDSGGINEAVAHEQTGLLVSEKAYKQLADSILQLYNNQTQWKSFSEAGQRRIKQLFNIQEQSIKLEAIYATIEENLLTK